jgi:hypothetical protein
LRPGSNSGAGVAAIIVRAIHVARGGGQQLHQAARVGNADGFWIEIALLAHDCVDQRAIEREAVLRFERCGRAEAGGDFAPAILSRAQLRGGRLQRNSQREEGAIVGGIEIGVQAAQFEIQLRRGGQAAPAPRRGARLDSAR